MKREEIIKSKGYNVTKLQNELFRQVNNYLEVNNMTRSQFAKELGVSKGYVSQILNGAFDFKLSKLVELSLSIGMIPEIKFTSSEEVIKKSRIPRLECIYLKENRETKIANRKSSVDFKNVDLRQIDCPLGEYRIAR